MVQWTYTSSCTQESENYHRIKQVGEYNIMDPWYLKVFDNQVPKDLMERTWEYVLDEEYHVTFYDPPASKWYPRTKTYLSPDTNYPSTHRCPLAWDDKSLEERSPRIFELWQHINNNVLDGKFEIEGKAEGMPNYMTGISPRYGEKGTPGIGWNVYIHGIDNWLRKRPKAIHRDNHKPEEAGYYTLVYFSNIVWYPSYFGETIFWADAPDTGDHTGFIDKDQDRGFPIGPASNVVSPLPGRFMLYDSRYLHGTKPVHVSSEHQLYGIVFRLRHKEEWQVSA